MSGKIKEFKRKKTKNVSHGVKSVYVFFMIGGVPINDIWNNSLLCRIMFSETIRGSVRASSIASNAIFMFIVESLTLKTDCTLPNITRPLAMALKLSMNY